MSFKAEPGGDSSLCQSSTLDLFAVSEFNFTVNVLQLSRVSAPMRAAGISCSASTLTPADTDVFSGLIVKV